MKVGRILASTIFGMALASNANAQSLTLEPMKTNAQEERTIRLSVNGGKEISTYGFVDFFRGNEKDKAYGELQLRHNLGSHGLQAEVNAGTGMNPVWRAGYIRDLLKDKGRQYYLNGKVLPVNLAAGKVQTELQLGTFGYVKIPHGFYLENWMDYTFADKKRPSLQTEFTAGKDIGKGLAIQGQAAYNANSSGWAFRAGGRYRLF